MSFSEDVGADIAQLLWFRDEDAQIRERKGLLKARDYKEMKDVVHDVFDSYAIQIVFSTLLE
jgi:hypothetical protein